LIVDPDLQSNSGHNYNATKAVVESAILNGFEPFVIANSRFDPCDDLGGVSQLNIFRVGEEFAHGFQFSAQSRVLRSINDISLLKSSPWERLLHNIVGVSEGNSFSSEDLIYCHTLSHEILHAIMQYFLLNDWQSLPKFYTSLYCDETVFQGVPIAGVSFEQLIRFSEASDLLGERIFIHVETNELSSHFSEKFDFNFPFFVGPIRLPKTPPQKSGRKPKVSFLGTARKEKGFEKLPGILEHCLESDKGHEIGFLVQVNRPELQHEDVAKAVKKLEAMAIKFKNIELVGELDDREYESVLHDSDIVLLPYDRVSYTRRGSGVAYEALSLGACVIATHGIDVTRDFDGLNIVTPTGDNPEDYAMAVLSASRNKKKFFRKAAKNLKKFSVTNFVSELELLHSSKDYDTQSVVDKEILDYLPIAPLTGGHGFVERAHLASLKNLRCRVRIFPIPWPTTLHGQSVNWKMECIRDYYNNPDVYSRIGMAFPFIGGAIDSQELHRCFADKGTNIQTIPTINNLVESFVSPSPIIQRLITTHKSSIILSAYICSRSFAEKIRVNNQRVICDICDDMSYQYDLERRVEQFPAELSVSQERWLSEAMSNDEIDEREIVSTFDGVIYLTNNLKSAKHSTAVGVSKTLLPPVANEKDIISPYRTSDVELISQYTVNKDVVHSMLRSDASSFKTDVDLLFVGGRHVANTRSLEDFILMTMPVVWRGSPNAKLFVVGSVCIDFDRETIDPRVVLCGFVPDVGAYYAAAKVVVISVSFGSGFPTKAIEAFSTGQCCTVLEKSLYDLSVVAGSYFDLCPTLESLGNDILMLLHDPDVRIERGHNIMNFYKEVLGDWSYDEGLSEILNLDIVQPRNPDIFNEREHIESSIDLRLSSEMPSVPLPGKLIDFCEGGSSSGVFNMLWGWSHGEQYGRWIDGLSCGVVFCLDRPMKSISIIGRLIDHVWKHDPSVDVWVNGNLVGSVKLENDFASVSLQLDNPVISESQVFFVKLVFASTYKPMGEARNLSAQIQQFRFNEGLDRIELPDTSLTDISFRNISINGDHYSDKSAATLTFSSTGSPRGASLSLEGWSYPEGNHRWILGNQTASVNFLHNSLEIKTLNISYWSPKNGDKSESISLEVYLNDQYLTTISPEEGLNKYSLELESTVVISTPKVTLKPTTYVSLDGDNRELAACIVSISLKS